AGFLGNRVGFAVQDDRRDSQRPERGTGVEIAQTVPHRLLHTTRDAKRSKIAGVFGIREIPRHAELERAFAVCLRVALAQPRSGELGALRLYPPGVLPVSEILLELAAMFAR